jgi:hypothetical protein
LQLGKDLARLIAQAGRCTDSPFPCAESMITGKQLGLLGIAHGAQAVNFRGGKGGRNKTGFPNGSNPPEADHSERSTRCSTYELSMGTPLRNSTLSKT